MQGRPFAVVDEVAAGSPAASAGVQLGDQWISFGRSDGSRGSTMASVAATLQVQSSQNPPADANGSLVVTANLACCPADSKLTLPGDTSSCECLLKRHLGARQGEEATRILNVIYRDILHVLHRGLDHTRYANLPLAPPVLLMTCTYAGPE